MHCFRARERGRRGWASRSLWERLCCTPYLCAAARDFLPRPLTRSLSSLSLSLFAKEPCAPRTAGSCRPREIDLSLATNRSSFAGVAVHARAVDRSCSTTRCESKDAKITSSSCLQMTILLGTNEYSVKIETGSDLGLEESNER